MLWNQELQLNSGRAGKGIERVYCTENNLHNGKYTQRPQREYNENACRQVLHMAGMAVANYGYQINDLLLHVGTDL